MKGWEASLEDGEGTQDQVLLVATRGPSKEPPPSPVRGGSWPRCYVITPALCTASGMTPMHLEHLCEERRETQTVTSVPTPKLMQREKWPRRLAASTAPVYQLVTPGLVHRLLHLTSVASSGNIGKGQAGSPHITWTARIPARGPPSPVQGEGTQRDTGGERGNDSPGLRRCQARSRLRARFSVDPAVSPKRQLSQSCPHPHIPRCPRPPPGLGRNRAQGGSVPATAVRHLLEPLLSHHTKRKPRAPWPHHKEEAKAGQSRPRSPSSHCPGTTKSGLTFLILSPEGAANQSGGSTKVEAQGPEVRGPMSLSQAPPRGEGKGGARSFVMKEPSSGEFSLQKDTLNWRRGQNAKEGHLKNSSEFS